MVLALVLDIFYPKKCQELVLDSVKNLVLDTVLDTFTVKNQFLTVSRTSSWHFYCQEPVLDNVKNRFLTVKRSWQGWQGKLWEFQELVLDTVKNWFLTVKALGQVESSSYGYVKNWFLTLSRTGDNQVIIDCLFNLAITIYCQFFHVKSVKNQVKNHF